MAVQLEFTGELTPDAFKRFKEAWEADLKAAEEGTVFAHPVHQHFAVEFFQSREPNDWRARITLGDEVLVIQNAPIDSILRNVANVVRQQAYYANLMIHGEPDNNE